MKNREAAAFIATLALSTAAMTSCAIFDAPSSVYGTYEEVPYNAEESEIIEVYGPAEDEPVVCMYGPVELDPDTESMDVETFEDEKPPIDGFEEGSLQTVSFGGITFTLPDYLTQTEAEDTDSMKFRAEETDTDFAELTFTKEITSGIENDKDCEDRIRLLEEEWDTIDNTVQTELIHTDGMDTYFNVTYDVVNGEEVCYLSSFILHRESETEAAIIRIQFTMTSGCAYDYRGDFQKIIENAVQE